MREFFLIKSPKNASLWKKLKNPIFFITPHDQYSIIKLILYNKYNKFNLKKKSLKCPYGRNMDKFDII